MLRYWSVWPAATSYSGVLRARSWRGFLVSRCPNHRISGQSAIDGGSELVRAERLADPAIRSRSTGEERVGVAIEQQDDGGSGAAAGCSRVPDRPGDGHAPHAPDLQVDEEEIRCGGGDGGGDGVRIVDHRDVEPGVGEGGANVVDDPGGICHQQDVGHEHASVVLARARRRRPRPGCEGSGRQYHAGVARRLFSIALLLLVAGPLGVSAWAQADPVTEVVVVGGSLDPRLIDFVEDAIDESRAEVVVIQLDSAATLDDIDRLLEVVEEPPLPVAVYAGPDPARVSGGALRMLAAAPVAGAAPGVVLGPASPTMAGGADDSDVIRDAHPGMPESIVEGSVVVEGDLGGFLDLVEPSIGQFVVGLDEREFVVQGSSVVVDTAVDATTDDGVATLRPRSPVTFVEPGLLDTTLRLGAGPEVAFFFLVAGLSLAVFEFYAAGPGMAAVAAVVCLLLAGYGIAVLPVQWWAVALVPGGLGLYTVDFQRNDLGWKSVVGTVALLVGGLAFTDAAPQMVQSWWIVAIVVLGAALWFGFALTTVVRARFSTQTIGRDHLIGRIGVAESEIRPEGTVLLDEATWQARSTRGSGIAPGDRVEVKAVEGVVLEVDPI